MGTATSQLAQFFDALPLEDQQEAMAQILRFPVESSYDSIPDEALCYAADQIFLGLDQCETHQ